MVPVPVVLFAYARPRHLERVLACLRENRVPLIYAFADGAKGSADQGGVSETRELLRRVDWCDLQLTERNVNLGLGRNVLAAVSEVAAKHEAFIAWEDDLVSVPGTYDWLCAALRRYANDARVMSVTAWTHPRVTPPAVGENPYFDRRAECWVWGGWSRSWRGMMDETAVEKLEQAKKRGVMPNAYGADLPRMAQLELRKNIWAVRWLYHHLEHGGLCLRPPWSMVEHIGFDPAATHASAEIGWANPALRAAPPLPRTWPDAVEHADCRDLWVAANPVGGGGARWKRALRRLIPRAWLEPVVQRYFRVRWEGSYPDWPAAESACEGYGAGQIVTRVVAAAREVKAGRAVYERDGVAFHAPAAWWPGMSVLREAATARGGALTVLDFGGSLGSLYFQVRSQLNACSSISWSVVEQPAFVEAGKAEFENDELKFYSSVSDACRGGVPDVLLLGSVLPYLADPWRVLGELLQRAPRWVVVDRTGFTVAGGSRLTVQRVPRSIYRASYPCWFFDRAEFLAQFPATYRLEVDRRDDIATPEGLEFRTLHFSRRLE